MPLRPVRVYNVLDSDRLICGWCVCPAGEEGDSGVVQVGLFIIYSKDRISFESLRPTGTGSLFYSGLWLFGFSICPFSPLLFPAKITNAI